MTAYEIEIAPDWRAWRMALTTKALQFETAEKAREAFMSYNGEIKDEPEIGLKGRAALAHRIVRVDGDNREVIAA